MARDDAQNPPANDAADAALRAPETEAALCGAMLLANDVIDVCADCCSSEDFSEPFFGYVFKIAVDEYGAGRPATPSSLRSFFNAKDFAAVAELTGARGSFASISTAREMALRVSGLAKRRRLVEALEAVCADTKRVEFCMEALVDSADTALMAALQQTQNVRTISFAQAFDETLQAIDDEAAGKGPQGIRIDGLADFNELTGDMRRGELLYLGGRPSMGKTALSLGLALGAAKAGHGVSIISLEMRAAELMTRAMADLVFEYASDCPTFEQVRRGKLSDRHRLMLAQAREQIAKWPLLITDPPSLNVGRLAMEIRRHKRRMAVQGQSLDLVIIDYLGLIKGSDKRQKRYEEVGDISRMLKQIAKECDVALIVLAQLNRECEKRDDKRPMLSDLRDAGDIEQDADHVLFVYRDEYYLERSEPDVGHKSRAEWDIAMGQARDKIELILAKARNGRVGKRVCFFFGKYQAVRPSDYMGSRR